MKTSIVPADTKEVIELFQHQYFHEYGIRLTYYEAFCLRISGGYGSL